MEGKVKLSLCLIKYHAMEAHWGVELYLHAFLISALQGVSAKLHASADLPPYPLDRNVGGPQNHSASSGFEPRSSGP